MYQKNKQSLIDDMMHFYGFLFCENCQTSSYFRLDCHHIMFRSEYPNHKNLHHRSNLILLCDKCHNKFHSDKSIRNDLIQERKLKELFNG